MFHFEVFITSAYFYIPHGSLVLFFVSYLFSIYSLRRKSLYQYFIHNSTESKVTAKQANTGVLWGCSWTYRPYSWYCRGPWVLGEHCPACCLSWQVVTGQQVTLSRTTKTLRGRSHFKRTTSQVH